MLICFLRPQGGSLANGTTVYGRDDVDSVIVVCFDYGTADTKELLTKHKIQSRKIMDTIEERLVYINPYVSSSHSPPQRLCVLFWGVFEG